MNNVINHLLKWGRRQLHESDTAALDVEILLAHLLKINRVQLYANANQLIDAQLTAAFAQLIARRAAREPVAYIIGQQEFWSLLLTVTPDTLIPRPETEMLVECVLANLPADQPCKIADLGTGSGAIALAIASERPHWQIIATDKMPAALAVAQGNAQQLKIANISFRQGTWCEALTEHDFAAIVSNPPYINQADKYWHEHTNLFEPTTALLAPEAGIADLRVITEQACHYLKPDGWLMLEHGYDQAAAIQQLLVQYGYKVVASMQDLASIDRIVVARMQ